jgi:hypothetical protein
LNPNITWEIVRDNPDKHWHWAYLSLNPNITWEIVKNNQNKPWNWWYLSENPNITWEIIRDNPDKEWNIFYFSNNISLYCPTVNRISKTRDIKYSRNQFKIIWENISAFSRNIDKLILKRLNYN